MTNIGKQLDEILTDIEHNSEDYSDRKKAVELRRLFTKAVRKTYDTGKIDAYKDVIEADCMSFRNQLDFEAEVFCYKRIAELQSLQNNKDNVKLCK